MTDFLKSALVAALLLLAGVNVALAQQQEEGDGFIAVMSDPTIEADVRATVNEFAVDYLRQGGVVNLTRTQEQLGEHVTAECAKDFACLQKVRTAQKLQRLYVANIKRRLEGGYEFTVVRADHYNYPFQKLGTVATAELDKLVVAIMVAVHELANAPLPKATLTVRAKGEGASAAKIVVNDKELGVGQWSGEVRHGNYTVTVTHPDPEFQPNPFTQKVELGPGQERTVTVEFKKPEVITPPTRIIDHSTRNQALLISGWVATGVGVVLTATGSGLYFVAQDLQSGIDTSCTVQSGVVICSGDEAQLRSDADTIDSYSKIAPALIGVGVPLLVGGLSMAILGHVLPDTEEVEIDVRLQGFNLLPTVGGAYGSAIFRF